MINLLFIEDDFVWQFKLEQMLANYKKFNILGFASTIKESKMMMEAVRPDIVVADLIIGRRNILDDYELVYGNIPTLFISNSECEEYFNLIQNIPKSAFLVKPFHTFSLLSSLELLSRNYLKKHYKKIIIKNSNKTFLSISLNQVRLVVVEGNYCVIHTYDGKKFAKKISLKRIISELDENFVQVNKSTILNRLFLDKIELGCERVRSGNFDLSVGRIFKKSIMYSELS